MLVAVASSDGQTLNQPFGKTPQFLIFEVDGDRIELKETRANNPREGDCATQGQGHLPIDGIIALLSDCEAIVCNRFGIGAYNELMAGGINPFQIKGTIEEGIRGYLNYKKAEEKIDRNKKKGK